MAFKEERCETSRLAFSITLFQCVHPAKRIRCTTYASRMFRVVRGTEEMAGIANSQYCDAGPYQLGDVREEDAAMTAASLYAATSNTSVIN